MHSLMQASFFEAESTQGDDEEIIISAEWMTLSEDEFRRIATEQHRTLDQQEMVIDALKNRIIHEKGELYIATKTKLGYGKFLDWLREIKVSPDKAQTYMQIIRDLGEEISNADRGRHLSYRTWRGIVRSPDPKKIAAKIESGDIDPIPQAINAEIEAAKKRAKEAEKESRLAQQQLFEEQSASQTKITELTRRIETLQREMAVFTSLEPVVPPEVQSQLKQLQAEITKLTEQKANLSQLVDELSADLDANEAQREQDARNLRIRQEWQKNTDALYKTVNKFLGQLPLPLDTQIFEAEDWSRLDQIVEAFQRGIAACRNLHASPSFVIDAGVM